LIKEEAKPRFGVTERQFRHRFSVTRRGGLEKDEDEDREFLPQGGIHSRLYSGAPFGRSVTEVAL